MNKTNEYYYVENGSIVQPFRVIVNGNEVTYNPFARPEWVGNSSIGSNVSDFNLADLNVFVLWTEVPVKPDGYYTQVKGPLVVEIDRVTRTDSWEAIPDNQIKDGIIASANNQIREYSNKELAIDRALKWNTDYDRRAYEKLIADLDEANDLDAFNQSLGAHPPSDVEYAKYMALQESEILALDTEIRTANGNPILSDTERTDTQSRVAANTRVADGEETGVRTPDSGAAREWVTLSGEEKMNAIFKEITFDWNTTPYYIPQITLPFIPEGTNMAQLFAMVYDQNNVYRSWMPFEEIDGVWKTPSNVSYLAIGKTSSSVWRVAVSQNGTSAEYEITSRVRLVPPDTAFSYVRWGGRT